jgi:hypothetical protein
MSTSTLFRHPHLTRGVVHTSGGSFVIQRGLVRVPEAVGAWHGWQRVQSDGSPDASASTESMRQPAGRHSHE